LLESNKDRFIATNVSSYYKWILFLIELIYAFVLWFVFVLWVAHAAIANATKAGGLVGAVRGRGAKALSL
jgi:hypothetical protein